MVNRNKFVCCCYLVLFNIYQHYFFGNRYLFNLIFVVRNDAVVPFNLRYSVIGTYARSAKFLTLE